MTRCARARPPGNWLRGLNVTATLAMSTLALAACSGTSLPSLSTGSLFGGSAAPPPAATAAAPAAAAPAVPVAQAPPPPPPSTLTDRAFNVGAVTARAGKCGYNFDAQRLKASYIASETATGSTPDDLAKLEKVYSIAFNGITKAAATEPDYCNATRTAEIKKNLGQLLAGDFTPPPKKVAAAEDQGMFGGLFGGSSSSSDEGVNSKPYTTNGY